MNGDNDTISKFKHLLGDKRKLIFTIPLGCLILLCFCCFSIFLLGYVLPPTLKLSADDNGKTVLEPNYTISLECSGVTQLKLNDKELSTQERDVICSKTGYKVDLVNGDNTFNLQGNDLKGQKIELAFTIKYDEDEHQRILAQQEQDRLAEQERQKQLEKENKRKQEEEAKQKTEQDAKALSEWKNKYYQYKSTNIDVNFTKSSEMIQVLSNGVDSYQSRNQANNYKQYFVSKCKATLENDLKPIPSTVNQEIKNLNTFYSDFCLYNYSLASKVVSYFESSSTQDQYNNLDMITYYMGEVNNAKLNMEGKMSVIDSKLK